MDPTSAEQHLRDRPQSELKCRGTGINFTLKPDSRVSFSARMAPLVEWKRKTLYPWSFTTRS
jgi:hypothetical protein